MTMLDAGVSLRDVQIAARHADPRTTMRYTRARENLDRHPTRPAGVGEGPNRVPPVRAPASVLLSVPTAFR
ncbi:hypothetical protein Van01_44070 [Micromonospora andamanensis]|uniref:Tyr recombinase domain-containing protein n=1 Tax=Micromonospora andamanensis TaxID=1287068 RepID=A0ABQ4HZU3_9ACTN|nr:hypothetical protein Van01_44070 [Micromonospora andamanensis]